MVVTEDGVGVSERQPWYKGGARKGVAAWAESAANQGSREDLSRQKRPIGIISVRRATAETDSMKRKKR